MCDKAILINSIDQLYDIQDTILSVLTMSDIQLHFVSAEHECINDKHGFLNNMMEKYKCIQIPTTLRDGALRFASNIENTTGCEIHFFCCVCGHQYI